MDISKANRDNGWTAQLVEWAKAYISDRPHCYIEYYRNAQRHTRPLRAYKQIYQDLIQALPTEALEVLKPSGEWTQEYKPAGGRKPGLCYRITDGWLLGEWVEDEAQDDGLTGGDYLGHLVDTLGTPLVLRIKDTVCLLRQRSNIIGVGLYWDGGSAMAYPDNVTWTLLSDLCHPAEINESTVEIIPT
jgi:hypothetical protein